MAKTTDILQSSYEKLLVKYKDLMILRSAESIVDWDMETRCLQEGSLTKFLLRRKRSCEDGIREISPLDVEFKFNSTRYN